MNLYNNLQLNTVMMITISSTLMIKTILLHWINWKKYNGQNWLADLSVVVKDLRFEDKDKDFRFEDKVKDKD